MKPFRHCGTQEIFDADQGGQFTIPGFLGLKESHGINVNMADRAMIEDKILIRRFWRAHSHTFLHLYALANGRCLRAPKKTQKWIDCL